MPLLALWRSDPDTVSKFTIEQVVSFAGNGKLRDDSECSHELREYIAQIPSIKLAEYIDQCLSSSFQNSGYALQDLVNELGRRLDYTVENGRYAGRTNAVGNDGLWHSPETTALVVEVKTTDAYRVSIDTIANYRNELLRSGKIDENSSILIVIGRQDTGELEAQVRCSRHAWDVRLVSAEALTKIVFLKENADEDETGRKIRGVLVPVEYTKIDALVDVVFTAAADVEPTVLEDDAEGEKEKNEAENLKSRREERSFEFTDAKALQEKRDQIIQTIAAREKKPLIKRTRAMYRSSDRSIRVACTISKRYDTKVPYWYAYHPSWHEFLLGGENGYFVLGCMDRSAFYSIPVAKIAPLLETLNTTERNDKKYWHIHLIEGPTGNLELVIPGSDNVDLNPHEMH